MAKTKTTYFCQDCGHEELRWTGKCPGCGAWNTMTEELRSTQKTTFSGTIGSLPPQPIIKVDYHEDERISTGFSELDRVLGGGIVPGMLILVGGDPGIGKSTLLLQAAYQLSQQGTVLYATGEESVKQIRLRANRLGTLKETLLVQTENNLDVICQQIEQLRPDVVVIDSIQTMFKEEISSAPGSVAQVRECTGRLMRVAKSLGTAIVIVGHVTKEGAIAGPRVLEHMVDTVLYFEGERHHTFRILRAVKNRFGSTNEIGLFEMTTAGLTQVLNPSEIFLNQRPQSVAGSVVVTSMEGTRPVLVEIQALVSKSSLAMPKRMATGVDYNRVAMLMAVLEKRAGLHMGGFDAYVNVAGGAKLSEPAIDVGVALALASSYRDQVIDSDLVVMGEVGLTGEIRAVTHPDKRLLEAAKLGFSQSIVPKVNMQAMDKELKNSLPGLKLYGVANITEAMEIAIGGKGL